MTFYPKLEDYVRDLKFSEIPGERRELLLQLAQYLQHKLDRQQDLNLNFICTHNSRRSQLCQVWAQTAAYYFQTNHFKAFSGGTETTAFHPNAVRALDESGFLISAEPKEKNPIYLVRSSENIPAVSCYSKTYWNAVPLSNVYAAVLTCSDAEANCPFIPEAEARFSLKYNDPKIADDSSLEQETYADRNRQIATEMFYLFSLLR